MTPLDDSILRECARVGPGDWTVNDVAAELGVPREDVGEACTRLRRAGLLEPGLLRLSPTLAQRLDAGQPEWDAVGVLLSGRHAQLRHVEVVRTLRRIGPSSVRDLGAALGKACADGSSTEALRLTLADLELYVRPTAALWLTERGAEIGRGVAA